MTLGRLSILVCALAWGAHARNATLLIRTDRDCRLTIDGKPRGIVKASGAIRVRLAAGEHRIAAVSIPEGAHWDGAVTAEVREFRIPLAAATAHGDYWIDPAGLMWATADNGSGVTWTQAANYCRDLTLGNYKDWTLPEIGQLDRLFGGAGDQSGHHIAGPIAITGWAWSATPGQEPGERWALDFGDGARASVVIGDSGLNRALCVRRR